MRDAKTDGERETKWEEEKEITGLIIDKETKWRDRERDTVGGRERNN
jgi:hypothetical protein